jgi:CDP-glucose 4,6-dehydratase
MGPDLAFWKGQRVLVTGHSGFQGRWLTLWLYHLGAKVTGFSLRPEQHSTLFSDSPSSPGVTEMFGDIREPIAITQCVTTTRPTIVFHLAAQSLQQLSYRDPVATYSTNVMGTVHLLDAIRKVGATTAAIIVTSDKCYENAEVQEPFAESAALGGADPYSSSKACAEFVIRAYRSAFFHERHELQCKIASVRPGNVIGGGDWSENRLLPDLVRAIVSDTSIPIRNVGGVRPWQHVLEPLSGYIRLAECLSALDGINYTSPWNLGPAINDCRPVSYIVEKFGSAWGKEVSWHSAAVNTTPEANVLKIDSSKALTKLGWNRQLNLDAAIDWTVEWYRYHEKGGNAEMITLDQILRYQAMLANAHD